MTSPHLIAEELKQLYGVYGYFFQLVLGDVAYPCRSVLELIAHELVPKQTNDILSFQPDLLVVMMNPGSSQPLDNHYRPVVIHDAATIGIQGNLVPTRPDTTQYQIMRVMAVRGWRHARVLNLSDLREPKSPLLIQKLQLLQGIPDGEGHSIFCKKRTIERQNRLGPSGKTPILVGWGRHKGLIPLATQCLEALRGWSIVGVPVPEDQALFAHPSPMLQRLKEVWVHTILNQLS